MVYFIPSFTLTDNDNPVYENPNPNANEPIYELVGPDSKDITLGRNEAYTDHMIMDHNTAYESVEQVTMHGIQQLII